MKALVILVFLLVIVKMQGQPIPELEPVVKLNGLWKFNIGDHPDWAAMDFDDAEWDQLNAPGTWEEQGYVGYDGYAWYRKRVYIPASCQDKDLLLYLGRIDDVHQLFFNGSLIGQAGQFPPDFMTGFLTQSLYAVPRSLVRFNAENTIAIRVYDEMQEGGIISRELVLGYNPDIRLISQNLAGTWKLAFQFDKESLEVDYDDSHWAEVFVPSTWESQGYSHYDGSACYRKSFYLNSDLSNDQVYLSLGKVDDRDHVFVNGKYLGSNGNLHLPSLSRWSGSEWQIRRTYRIPSGLLNSSGRNTIVVIVEDFGGMGGIFEGSVGLMTRDQFLEYQEKYKQPLILRRNFFFWSLFF